MTNIDWFQLHNGENILLFFVLGDSKVNIILVLDC